LWLFCGTAEAVPFQNKNLLDIYAHAIALGSARCGAETLRAILYLREIAGKRPEWNRSEAGNNVTDHMRLYQIWVPQVPILGPGIA
jgi:hypothetical protein